MSNQSNFKKWQSRLDFIAGEFPFGPMQEVRDEDGRMHCETGPAYISPTRVTYYEEGRRNGIDVDIFGSIAYYFKDVLVPRKYLLEPENVTFDEVIGHDNAEVRRIGVEVYGFDRMIEEGRFKLIHSHEKGDLYKASIEQVDEKPITIVRVTDSTDVPGAGRRKYILQVPPEMEQADEAVAWTFGKTAETYHPEIET